MARSSTGVRIVRLIALGMLVLATSALAANQKLQKAQDLYDSGAFAQARDAFRLLASDPAATEKERTQARLYLAASEFALGDSLAAKKDLQTLALLHPEVKPDPDVFLPDFVALAESARKDAGVSEPSRKKRKKTVEEGEVARKPVETKPPPVTETQPVNPPPAKVEAPPVTTPPPPVAAQVEPHPAPPAVTTAPLATPITTETKTMERPSATPWLISGGAALAAGLGGMLYGLSVHSKVEDQLAGMRNDVSRSQAKTGAAVFDVGLAATAIGAGLLGYGVYRSVQSPAAVAIAPVQGGAVMVTEGRF
jgi:hypothetical protein